VELEAGLQSQDRPEVLPWHEAHRDVERVADRPGFVDRDDGRVLDRRREAGFAFEAGPERRLRRELGRQDLEGDRTLERHVRGAEDHPHPAMPDERVDAISTEDRAQPQALRGIGSIRGHHTRS
jgi:hypothetical protein